MKDKTALLPEIPMIRKLNIEKAVKRGEINLGWSYFNYINKNVSEENMQTIIDKFPDEWMRFYGKRDQKLTRQNWGWATIVDISNPWNDYQDDELGKVGVVVIGGAYGVVDYDTHSQINTFILEELRKLGYKILRTKFDY